MVVLELAAGCLVARACFQSRANRACLNKEASRVSGSLCGMN